MPLEKMLRDIEGIESVTTFVGIGPPRFTAITQPEQPNPAYAHMIVEVADVEDMNGQMIKAQTSLMNARPDSEIQVRRAEFSPGRRQQNRNAVLGTRYQGSQTII